MKWALGIFVAVVLYLWWQSSQRPTVVGQAPGQVGLFAGLGALVARLAWSDDAKPAPQKPNAAAAYPLGARAPMPQTTGLPLRDPYPDVPSGSSSWSSGAGDLERMDYVDPLADGR